MSLLEALNKMVAEGHDEEIINDCRVEDAARCVDLTIAYSPIVDAYVGTRDLEAMMMNPRLVPQPIKPRKDGSRWYTTDARAGTWRWFTEEQMKTGRARFLLLRNHFYRFLGGFGHDVRQQLVADYFEGGVWRPDPDTPLGKAMGIVA